MDIKGSSSKITTCTTNSPCTASIGTGSTCSAASLPLDGVLCSLPACPAIEEGSDWNIWSASCAMGTHNFNVYPSKVISSGQIVKIKKSSSMSGELVIDREATSGNDRHFVVSGTLEMEDITLQGGSTVSSVSFVLLL